MKVSYQKQEEKQMSIPHPHKHTQNNMELGKNSTEYNAS